MSKEETTKKGKKEEEEPKVKPLDKGDILLLQRYGKGPYNDRLKKIEDETKGYIEKINKLIGIRESDTGLAQPSQWTIEQDA
jgi:26S proteasome regulatory subunit T1